MIVTNEDGILLGLVGTRGYLLLARRGIFY